MSIFNQKLLTLNFWQNTVTYAGCTKPTGSIACDALNISDDTIAQINAFGAPLAAIVALIMGGSPTAEDILTAKEPIGKILGLMGTTPPFSLFGFSSNEQDLDRIFCRESADNTVAYIKAARETGAAAALEVQYSRGMELMKLISELAQLGGTLMIYKQGMTGLAHALHASERTPNGYAAAVAQYFSDSPLLSSNHSGWMQMTNTTVQYVSAVTPGSDAPQLIKRMHYVSFAGMLRSDLFEGLCVGHAPRKCPICERWFLTTDARHTKYCGGLAPGDKRGRTCRQIGNLQGRTQRELADDHPIKAIYTRRMNTITQYLRRGVLDEQTAAEMKRLAKNRMQRAIKDCAYANSDYQAAMTQTALRTQAEANLK